MDKVELIKAEVEKRLDTLYDELPDGNKVIYVGVTASEANITGKYTALESLLDYIKSLQEEPVNKDYEKAAKEYRKFREECGVKDPVSLNEIEEAYYLGMETLKEQMMEDAIEREVKIDSGGYPYIDATELYDYEKDIPLAKVGDKVKVTVIKEG